LVEVLLLPRGGDAATEKCATINPLRIDT
jgi:hypothetical protein